MNQYPSAKSTMLPPEPRVKILLVDDEPANLYVLEAVLGDLGHQLVKASSGEAALRQVLAHDFAVVLLDVRMYGMDGFETAQRIRGRERSRHTPIVFLTAHDDNRLPVEEAYSLGAVDYLIKPVQPTILRAKVAVFVDLFRKTEQVQRQAEQLRQMERREFERKLAEENARLRESEQRIRTLSDNLPHGAIYQAVVDREGRGRFTYFSAGIERLFGISPEEVVKDAAALYALIHEEDLPRVRAAEEAALRNLGPFDCEFRHRTRSGGLLWVHCRSAPRRLPDGGAVWDGVVLDVTDRKKAEEASRESEERFRRLLDSNIVGVGISDAGGSWLEANDELLRLLGYSRDELRAGKVRWIDMTPARFLPRDEEGIAEARRRGACAPYEKEYIRKDGTAVPVLIGYTPLQDGGDRFICFVLDLTPQKRVEAALKDADRRKDEFLAMLAHELRNPLAPIRNAAQVLRMLAAADPKRERATDMIERQVTHLARLVDDLLDVSRFTEGKIKLHREPAELADVIARAVETSRPLIDARRHDLTVTLPAESVHVEADATRLAQVVSNLLNNAAKYTEDGGRIWLTVERTAGEAILRVKDAGMGIPADLLPHVFDLFTQGDRSLARSEGGLGIGLTLVRSLVEMHGGTVTAFSDGPGKGSEFVVRLPTLAAMPSSSESSDVAARPVVPSRRVLIVDDNADAAEMLAMMLTGEGHEVRTAHDGPAALDAAAAFGPDVVFLDIGLPRMDGYEVARRLRRQAAPKRPLLVALTGYGQDEDRRKAEEAGFDAHLVKPAEPAALHALLAGNRATT